MRMPIEQSNAHNGDVNKTNEDRLKSPLMMPRDEAKNDTESFRNPRKSNAMKRTRKFYNQMDAPDVQIYIPITHSKLSCTYVHVY